MDGPEHADTSEELEVQVSDVRSGVPPIDALSPGSPFAPRRPLSRRLGLVAALVALAVVGAASPGLRAPALALLRGLQAAPTATLLPAVRASATTDLTPLPGTPLRWQPTAPPPDLLNAVAGPVHFAVAPSDGRIAYLCDVSPPPQGTPTPTGATSRFWVTQDRGAQWTPALSISAQANATICTSAIDALDPSLVVLASSYSDLTAPSLPASGLPSPTQTVSEVTFDGGATWQRLAGNQLLFQPATVHGVTFVLRLTQPGQDPSAPVTTELAMSSDQLHTWTPIDAAIRAATPPEQVVSYWLNPTNGALLAVTQDAYGGSTQLWSSADTGQHWRKLSITLAGAPGRAVVVQPPMRDAPWHICAATTIGNNDTSVVCSADGGATWTRSIAMPAAGSPPRFGVLDGVLGDTRSLSNIGLLLATDGALLLHVQTDFGAGTGVLYRLTAGTTRWQTLGPVPDPAEIYSAGPGAGTLWAGFGPQGRLFTASYP